MAFDPPQRLVIIRPSALGDVCRTVPVLASLRAALPKAHIAWVVQDDFAPAIEAHPALSEVIAFPRSRFGHWWYNPARAAEVARWFVGLRKRRFDVALDCQGLGRSGIISAASGAKMRIGLRSGGAREFAWLCYNRRVPENRAPLPRHTVERMLCVLEPLAIAPKRDMRLYPPPAAMQWWASQRASLGVNANEPYAVIAPGARWSSKRWPIERFAELIEPLLARGFGRVVIIGSQGEREQIAPLAAGIRGQGLGVSQPGDGPIPKPSSLIPSVIDLVGRTSIAQSMTIVAEAGLVIANDSAPLHMAVGFDRPCVGLFGPTDPHAVGPYGRAECAVRAYRPSAGAEPNFKNGRLGDSLMRLISTALALQTIDRVLALWPQRNEPSRHPVAETRSASAARCADAVPVQPLRRGFEPEAAS